MIPSIATVTLGGPLTEKLHAAARAGFEGVEIFDTDLETNRISPSELQKMTADVGLSSLSLFPLRDFEGMPSRLRISTFDRAKRYLDVAHELHAKMVMVCSNVHPESMADPDCIASDLLELAELAAERNLKIAYEALSWGRHVYDYRVAWDLVCRADHSKIGLVLDTFHILARDQDVEPIDNFPPEKIFLVQISDAPWLRLDYMSLSRHHRILPGQGAFSYDEFLAALERTGYDGVFSLECFNDSLRERPADEVAVLGRQALTNLWSTAMRAEF